jgi:hypothetical protein
VSALSGIVANGCQTISHVSPKRRLGDAVLEYFGKDIITQVLRKPNRKDSLDASRARLACREERRHL